MGLINITPVQDGTSPQASQVNNPLNTIVNEFNGNIDNNNISASAGIAGSKLADNAITTAKINDGAVTPSKLGTGAATAIVATSESTTSTSYTDLTTTTDTVTVNIGANGLALVSIYSYLQHNNASGNSVFVSFAVSGANTIAASDERALRYQTWTANAFGQFGATFLLTGLTPGSTTFKMKYRGTSASTSIFLNRRISVIPL